MEHQSSDFNALPGIFIHRLWVHKCGVRNSPSATVELRIETLDQSHLLWRLPVQVVPFVVSVGSDGVCLASSVWVDQVDDHEIGVWNTVCVRNSKRVLENTLDGTPHIDNLISSLKELVGLIWKMVWNSGLRSLIRLINVNAINWATK